MSVLQAARAERGTPLGEYRPKAGAHLASLWTDPAAERHAAAAFFNARPDVERALWVVDLPRDDSAAPAEEYAITAVVFSTTDRVYLQDGYFDPERTRGFWRDRAGQDRGTLRVVAEMSWQLRGERGTEDAPQYESSLNPALTPLPMSVICQYGSSRFSAETILAVVLSHPEIVIGQMVSPNPFHVSDDAFSRQFGAQREDAPAALMPIWQHFLHRLPSLREAALCLCNALPALTGAERVTVALTDLSAGFTLDAARDQIIPVSPGDLEAAAPNEGRLQVMWPGSAQTVGGAVTARSGHSLRSLEASYHGGAGRLLVHRRSPFAPDAVARFVTAASTLGVLMRRNDFPGSLAGL